MYYSKENEIWYRDTEIEIPKIVRTSRRCCLVDEKHFEILYNKSCRPKLIIKDL